TASCPDPSSSGTTRCQYQAIPPAPGMRTKLAILHQGPVGLSSDRRTDHRLTATSASISAANPAACEIFSAHESQVSKTEIVWCYGNQRSNVPCHRRFLVR